MQDYKITKVVKRDPWSNDFGKFQTYAIQFDNKDNWVQWNKKFKGDEEPTPPELGDEVYGEVVNGKFKIGKKDGGQNFYSSTSKPAKKEWQPRDDSHIKAQWAIGQAMSHFANKDKVSLEDVEKLAGALFEMVDRVKGNDPKEAGGIEESAGSVKGAGYEAFKAAGGQVKADLPPVDTYDDIINSSEPINAEMMASIPF